MRIMDRNVLFQKVWNIAKLSLAIILIIIVGAKTNFYQIRTLKADIAWGWFSIHVLSFIIMTLVKASQYHLLIGGSIKYKNVIRIVIWQNTISNFVASGAGIASYMAMLRTEQNVKLTRSGVTFIITKFGDLLAICLFLGISAGLVWHQIQTLRLLTFLLISGILLGATIFIITIIWRGRFVTLLVSVIDFLKLNHFSWVLRGEKILQSLAQEDQDAIFRMMRIGVLMSFAYMTITMVSAITSIWMFNIHLEIWPLIYVASLMQLVSFVPIQVLGGLGVSEVTSVYLYSFFGLGQGKMSAVMLGLRAIFYLMNALMLLYLPISAFLGRNTKKAGNPF